MCVLFVLLLEKLSHINLNEIFCEIVASSPPPEPLNLWVSNGAVVCCITSNHQFGHLHAMTENNWSVTKSWTNERTYALAIRSGSNTITEVRVTDLRRVSAEYWWIGSFIFVFCFILNIFISLNFKLEINNPPVLA